MSIAVVGAGIAGLVAAHELAKRGAEVVVIESDDRLGGKIRTTTFGGIPIEEGPDAFLVRRPEAVALCAELGLTADLVHPATGKAWLWTRGALQPIPEGTVLGVPTDRRWWRTTDAVSWPGKLRSALDAVLPDAGLSGDVSIGQLIAHRFGTEVADRLVDPLLGGINAGRIDRLSLAASAPQIAAAAARGGSLGRALRAGQPAPAGTDAEPAPVFATVRDGLGVLVDRLAERLGERHVEVRTGVSVTGMSKNGTGWTVRTNDGDLVADGVVVATPAFTASSILAGVAPEAAAALATVEYASVAVVTARFERSAVRFPEGSGFLVPRIDGRLLSAATWYSAKWPHIADDESIVVRLSAGKVGDDRVAGLDDDALVERLLGDLGDATGCRVRPAAVRVSHWSQSFPQYDVGHLELVDRIERSMPSGVAVAGAALHGVGIPACIGSGRIAAAHIVGAVQRGGSAVG